MARREESNIVIISDLHLSEGRDPRTKKFDLNEDFFFDEQFDRFLSDLENEAEQRSRTWRFIINGDMFDFLQVTRLPDDSEFQLRKSEKQYGLGTSTDKTAWKLKVMMDGHWLFFKALGRFISTGNTCTIITGNHDIEWTVPEVRNAFREEMKKYLPDGIQDAGDIVSQQIEFCPWFYYEPGLIWVEHGNQYDGINSFDYLLFPYLPDSDELMLPGGSFFVRYLFNHVEQKDPFADNIKPMSAYITEYWPELLFSSMVMKHARYFLEILRKIRKFEDEELEYLRVKNEKAMKAEAKRFGINIKKLQAIQSRWVPCFLYNKGMLENIWSFVSYKPGENHRKMASLIREELDVRYVAFGHTHEADLLSFSHDAGAEYANSGTWTKIFSSNPAEKLLHEEQESVFIRILKDEGDKLDLMKWRDDLGEGERVKLFETRSN
jgi:UDP-2,3-diacylglucosamine pyrophosphatase LpxH